MTTAILQMNEAFNYLKKSAWSRKQFIKKITSAIIFIFLISPFVVFASEGLIDSNYKYAWGDTIGWVNFSPPNGNVKVSDTQITGYAWSENYGWINLNPSNGGVFNDGNGNLSGYAWGENLGWIDFSNVKINPSTGEFSGYAIILGGPGGIINFDCNNCKVKTLWKKFVPPVSGFIKKEKKETVDYSYLLSTLLQILTKVTKPLISEKEAPLKITPPVYEFLRPQIVSEGIIERILKPLGLTYTQKSKPLLEFIQFSLPKEILEIAEKIEIFKKRLEALGIKSLSHLTRLQKINLYIPPLSEILNLSLPINLAKLPIEIKNKIPEDILFVSSKNGTIDLKISLNLEENFKVIKKIKALPGEEVSLIIKPSKPVENIYGVLNLLKREISFYERLRKVYGNILSFIGFGKIEQGFASQKFYFNDEDNDGIYRANLKLPYISGEYEITTNLAYKDNESKEIKLRTEIIPNGYVYENFLGKEVRVGNAKVSLYSFNSKTNNFELWNAKEFFQENPIITNRAGEYSFLVPSGKYYLVVEAKGYYPYKSEEIVLQDTAYLSFPIELKNRLWIFSVIDWKIIVIILLGLALLYLLRKKY